MTRPKPHMLRAGGRPFWHIHKYDWPMEYWYVFTREEDSIGEETDPLHAIDVRTLPLKYIADLNLSWVPAGRKRPILKPPACGMIANQMHAHSVALGRAVDDGFDFEAHARAERARADAERDEYKRRLAAATVDDDDVPF